MRRKKTPHPRRDKSDKPKDSTASKIDKVEKTSNISKNEDSIQS